MVFIKKYGRSRGVTESGTKSIMAKFPRGLRSILEAVIVVLILRWLAVEAHAVPTGSMIPTIIPHEYLLAEKISYRFYDPQPGDVVVFKYPVDGRTDYVKRCIAIEGQTVEFRDRVLYIDGTAVPDPHAHFSNDEDPVPFLFDISSSEWQKRWEARGEGTGALVQYLDSRIMKNPQEMLPYFGYYFLIQAEKEGFEIDTEGFMKTLAKQPIKGRTWKAAGTIAISATLEELLGKDYNPAEYSGVVSRGVDSVPNKYAIINYAIADNFPKITVPEDMIMCIGDNRCESFDSRYWGPVSTNKVKGRPIMLYYSLINPPPDPNNPPSMVDNVLVLFKSFFRPADIRFDRFFRLLF
jgi:signal peptidase I